MDFKLLQDDSRAMQADLPFYATYKGVEYLCNVVSMDVKVRDFLQNTINQRVTLTLAFVIVDLIQTPDEGDIVTFQGKDYRVLQTDLSPDLIDVRVYLGDKYAS